MSEVKTPWKDYMGDVPMHLDYFQGSMFEAVERMAELYPNNIAFDFMGKSTTYKKMVQEIEKCAKSLKTLGVRPGDKVTIAMPNCPQAIYMFYAVNLVGGIANMIHPLSAEKEIEFYLNASESTTAITLDQFYDKFEHIRQNTGIINIIMKLAPLGAFGAMAFTVGKYGLGTLGSLSYLMGSFYLTCLLFVFVVLNIIARLTGFSLVKLLRYIAHELWLVLGTSSSESALPTLMAKLEHMGARKDIVGIVVPSGYSFNLDGTSTFSFQSGETGASSLYRKNFSIEPHT